MIYSCKGCVPPKRHTGCHGDCPEYLAQKAEHDRQHAEEYKQKEVKGGIYYQRDINVRKAIRKRKKGKNYGQ